MNEIISITIPVFNEAENIEVLYGKLLDTLRELCMI